MFVLERLISKSPNVTTVLGSVPTTHNPICAFATYRFVAEICIEIDSKLWTSTNCTMLEMMYIACKLVTHVPVSSKRYWTEGQ